MATRTKVLLEYDGRQVDMEHVVQRAKADAKAKHMRGDLIVYINTNESAAYYTVNGIGGYDERIEF